MSTITATTVTRLSEAAAAEAKGFRLATTEQMKTWARKNGVNVPEAQGRPSQEAIDAFNKAHKRNRLTYVTGVAPQPTTNFVFTTAAGRESKFDAVTEDVRAWAQEQGMSVGARGRLPRAVIDAYGQAHAKPRKARKPKADASA